MRTPKLRQQRHMYDGRNDKKYFHGVEVSVLANGSYLAFFKANSYFFPRN